MILPCFTYHFRQCKRKSKSAIHRRGKWRFQFSVTRIQPKHWENKCRLACLVAWDEGLFEAASSNNNRIRKKTQHIGMHKLLTMELNIASTHLHLATNGFPDCKQGLTRIMKAISSIPRWNGEMANCEICRSVWKRNQAIGLTHSDTRRKSFFCFVLRNNSNLCSWIVTRINVSKLDFYPCTDNDLSMWWPEIKKRHFSKPPPYRGYETAFDCTKNAISSLLLLSM